MLVDNTGKRGPLDKIPDLHKFLSGTPGQDNSDAVSGLPPLKDAARFASSVAVFGLWTFIAERRDLPLRASLPGSATARRNQGWDTWSNGMDVGTSSGTRACTRRRAPIGAGGIEHPTSRALGRWRRRCRAGLGATPASG